MPIMVHTPNQSNSKTGVPPIFMNADGNALTAWSISGQTVQSGTPTPDAPIMPTFCGVRTANLFPLDATKLHVGRIENDGTIDYEVGTITVGADSISYQSDTAWRGFYTDFIQTNENDQLAMSSHDSSNILFLSCNCYDENDNFLGKAPAQSTASIRTFTMLAGTKKVRISITGSLTEYTITNPMLNTGSTALPYEPYGWAEKITCAGQTTPVYLGQTQTVRRIKKLVLDGTENWNGYGSSASGIGASLLLSDILPNSRDNGLCTHFSPQYSPSQSTIDGITFGAGNNLVYITFSATSASALNITNTASFKAYLAAQYAAGTPITVWYVLATEQTAIVNEPLCKIGDYADTVSSTNTGAPSIPTSEGYQNLTVGTTVQPSNVSVSYNLPELSECSHIYVKTDGLPQTKTGTTPMTFKANGQPLTAYTIIGNGQQAGTPTPDAPIMPQFVGVRTANLFDRTATNTNNGYISDGYLKSDGSKVENVNYRASEYIAVPQSQSYTLVYGGQGVTFNAPSVCFYDSSKNFISGVPYNGRMPVPFTTPQNTAYLRISFRNIDSSDIMLNAGSTDLPYEPYGWAEKITCAGQTTPVYLGQTQTVRRVKKYVFTGEENGTIYSTSTSRKGIEITGIIGIIGGNANTPILAICTHYQPYSRNDLYRNTDNGISNAYQNDHIIFYDLNCQTVEAFNQFCAQQYTNGTPVTIWYVLDESQTAIVNEPLCKIGDYADTVSSTNTGAPSIPTVDGANTLSVDTTAQPSSVTIGYGAPKYSEVTSAPDAAGVLVYTTG